MAGIEMELTTGQTDADGDPKVIKLDSRQVASATRNLLNHLQTMRSLTYKPEEIYAALHNAKNIIENQYDLKELAAAPAPESLSPIMES